MKPVAWLLVATALAVGSGCARPDWIEQTLVTVDVSGVWRGTFIGGNRGAMELTLHQRGPKVTGELKASPFTSVNGPIEGTVSGDILKFRDARGQISGELQVNGDEMTGRAAGGPAGPLTITLQRQP